MGCWEGPGKLTFSLLTVAGVLLLPVVVDLMDLEETRSWFQAQYIQTLKIQLWGNQSCLCFFMFLQEMAR